METEIDPEREAFERRAVTKGRSRSPGPEVPGGVRAPVIGALEAARERT